MTSYQFSFLVLLSTLLISACANKSEFGKRVHNIFTTDIHPDGSKRFILAMVNPDREHAGGPNSDSHYAKRGDGGGRPSRGDVGASGSTRGDRYQGNRSSSEDNKYATIVVLLDEKIIESGYCRNGYIELDYSQMRGRTEIVGECQESASEQDKQRWK